MGAHVDAPSRTAKLEPQINSILTEKWINAATVCIAIHTWVGDPCVSYALKRMSDAGRIERKAERGLRGKAYFYRRAA